MRQSLLFASALVLTLLPVQASAQTDLERATAREAANMGRAQFDAGRYTEAIDSFTRAQQLVSAPPHLLYLARAQAKVGRLLEARENYLKITRLTLPAKSPKAFVEAQSAAERELEAIDPRLPSVTIAVQGAPTKDVSVLMDGSTLASAMIGIPLPVDPGQHVFEAEGSNARSAPVTVMVSEGAKETVMLTLRATAPAGAGASSAASSNANVASAPLTTDTEHSTGSGLRIGSYVAFGIGAVGLGLGTYFLLKGPPIKRDANSLFAQCNPSDSCGSTVVNGETLESQINSKDDEATHLMNWGIGSMVVGGLGVVTGATLLILSASHKSTAQANGPSVMPVFGYRTVGLVGQF